MSECCMILSSHDTLQDAELDSVFLRLGMSEKMTEQRFKISNWKRVRFCGLQVRSSKRYTPRRSTENNLHMLATLFTHSTEESPSTNPAQTCFTNIYYHTSYGHRIVGWSSVTHASQICESTILLLLRLFKRRKTPISITQTYISTIYLF